MPAPLALFLCTLFVGWMLRIDHRQSDKVTSVVWLPTLWFFAASSKPLGRWFGWGESSLGDGSPLDRMFLFTILCIGLIVLLRRGLAWEAIFEEYVWVFILLGFMFVSILWTDDSFVSFKRWIRELTAVVMGLVLATEPHPRAAFRCVMRRMSYVLVPFSLLLIKYFPNLGVAFHDYTGASMWVGVTTQKNSLGRLCLLVSFFLIWTLIRRRRGIDLPVVRFQTAAEIGILVLALWMLKGPGLAAYSATSVACLTVGLGAYLGLLWMKNRGMSLPHGGLNFTLFMVLAVGIATPFLSGATVSAFTVLLGRDATLTGRTDIWAGAIAHAEPFLGSGIGGFWTSEMRYLLHIGVAHNGYLEAFLNFGVVGLTIVALFLLSCARKAVVVLHRDFEWGCLGIGILFIGVVHNITESSIHSFTTQMTATILFFAVTSIGVLRSG